MYRWEIQWYEYNESLGREQIHFKGFTSEERYRKFMKRLENKGCRITGRIEDGRRVQ